MVSPPRLRAQLCGSAGAFPSAGGLAPDPGRGGPVSLAGGAPGFSCIPSWSPGARRRGWDEPALCREDIGRLVGHGVDGLQGRAQRRPEPPEPRALLPGQRGTLPLLPRPSHVLTDGLRQGAHGGHQPLPKWGRPVSRGPAPAPTAAPGAPRLLRWAAPAVSSLSLPWPESGVVRFLFPGVTLRSPAGEAPAEAARGRAPRQLDSRGPHPLG